MKLKSRLFAYSFAALALLQSLTILSSWIVSALWPSLGVKSLLGNDGIRWLLSSFPENVSSPCFIWLLLLFVVYGSFRTYAFGDLLRGIRHGDFRDKFAGRIFFFVIFVGISLCLVVAFVPHSLALGVSGKLFPGPFLKIAAFLLLLSLLTANLSFLFFSGRLRCSADFEKMFSLGIQTFAPLIVIYFMLKELLEMLVFVLPK